jgi:hypothetical protein
MSDRCISQIELAQLWEIGESTLERWRAEGIGPVFLKLRGQVRRRLVQNQNWPLRPQRSLQIVSGTSLQRRFDAGDASRVSAFSKLSPLFNQGS